MGSPSFGESGLFKSVEITYVFESLISSLSFTSPATSKAPIVSGALGSVIRLTLKSVPRSARAAAAKVAASAEETSGEAVFTGLTFPHIPFENVALAFSAVNSPVKPAFSAKPAFIYPSAVS